MPMIPLGNGIEAEVDPEDHLPALLVGAWHLSKDGYAYSRTNGFLHLFIAKRTNLHCQETIDHKNRNRLDCKRSNLRDATHLQQAENSSTHRDNTSGVKCIHWNSRRKKWQVRVQRNGKRVHVAVCTLLQDAIDARDAYLKLHNMEMCDG